MKTLLIVNLIPAFQTDTGAVTYVSSARIDGDGTGPSHGDICYQNQTSYKPDLNADEDNFTVWPPQLILAVKGRVLGCHCYVENLSNGLTAYGLVGDVGPHNKLGELSIAYARALGIPSSPINGGEDRHVIRYTVWPGEAAMVGDKKYVLQAYQ